MLHPLTRRTRYGLLVVAALLLFPANPSGQRGRSASTPSPPRLAVMIVVDQMRADYVDRFQADWTSGLKRLVTQGAWFTRAAYPYLETYTCAGHATVSTGAFPHVHGIFQNTWFDRGKGGPVQCTDDDNAEGVAYSGTAGNDGPGLLLVPTFADEMRRQRSARVVSLSLKARSAIMLAGHGGDAVTWINDSLDGWQTSRAYSPRPVPAVKAYLDANPIEADYGKVWRRILPVARYPEADAGEGEAPIPGWTSTFPHRLTGGSSSPDSEFQNQWQHSPFADAYLGRMAGVLAESFRLGRRGTTDVLAVSFSSPDLVGHQFGPDSQEVRDMFAHLDRTIGQLLGRLDALVGRNQYVVALTADHGVTEIPEQLKQRGESAGRMTMGALSVVVQKAAETALGPGQYLARVVSNDVYFRPGVYDRLRQRPDALKTIIEAIAAQPGVAQVLRSDELAEAAQSGDPQMRAATLSYVPGRSGDLMLVLKPGWMFSARGTTHGTLNPDDQRVPVLLMGPGIRPGAYTDAATPADVAPTLAAIVGITLPRAEGRALAAAVGGLGAESAAR